MCRRQGKEAGTKNGGLLCALGDVMSMELADDLASKQSSSKYYLSPTGGS